MDTTLYIVQETPGAIGEITGESADPGGLGCWTELRIRTDPAGRRGDVSARLIRRAGGKAYVINGGPHPVHIHCVGRAPRADHACYIAPGACHPLDLGQDDEWIIEEVRL